MAQAELAVDRSKSDIVTTYQEHIELLFDVTVRITPHSDEAGFVGDGSSSKQRSPTFVTLYSSSASQKSIEKATVYLRAALKESKDWSFEHQILPHAQFEMVVKNSCVIERQSLAVLGFDAGSRTVSMKGQRASVEAAKQQIHLHIMGQHNTDCHPLTHTVATLPDIPPKLPVCDKDSGVEVHDFKTGEILFSSPRDMDNNMILPPGLSADSMNSFSLTTDAEEEFPPFSAPEALVSRGSGSTKSLSRTFAQVVSVTDSGAGSDVSRDNPAGVVELDHKNKDMYSEHSSSSSSDEDSGVSVVDKSDPRYESRLEFAVKLGYTEDNFDRVINRHGLECDENRMLQDLIEGSAGASEVEWEVEVAEDVGSTSIPQDLDSMDLLKGVLDKVGRRQSEDSSSNLRPIVIDGSNVAMSHGKNVFSCQGIKIAVDWFRQRGHQEITVFVPQWRKEASRPDTPITDQNILLELEKENIVVFTPARRIKGRRVVCYDDRFVLKLGADINGIVVSNDNYRDLLNENHEFRTVVDERLLMYTFVNDRFMPPEDPLGRRGPTLDNFLSKEPSSPPSLPPDCPYGRKCTYGNKCKYNHPERGSGSHRMVTEVLREQASLKMQERAVKGPEPLDRARCSKPKLTRTRSLIQGTEIPPAAQHGNPSSLLPPGLREPDADALGRVKAPSQAPTSTSTSASAHSNSNSKTSDYLSEHRKKLEKLLAKTASADPESSRQPGGTYGASPEPPPGIPSPREALSPLPFGSRVSSPSRLNVPYSASGQDGGLVSGHLLLAKKLSDEAADTSFFSAESFSNRASPNALAGPAVPASTSYGLGNFYGRRPSLQDHRFSHQPSQSRAGRQHLSRDADSGKGCLSGPAGLQSHQMSGYQQDPSFQMPGFSSQYHNFPTSEGEPATQGAQCQAAAFTSHPSGMYMQTEFREQVPLKAQHSCPAAQFTQTQFSKRPFKGMMRQNSSSDTQLHMAGSVSESSFNPLHPTSAPPPLFQGLIPRGGPDYSSTDPRLHADSQKQHHHHPQHQSLSRSMSMQPFSGQPFSLQPGLDRQTSEVPFQAPETPMSPYHYPPQWDFRGPYASHPSATPHLHHHLQHQPPNTPLPTHQPPPFGGMPSVGGMSPWQQQVSSHPAMPPSPVKKQQQQVAPARSYPPSQAITPKDERYTLYYNLCSIFAEPRVRAIMNKYPDQRDPQKLTQGMLSLDM